MYGAGGNRNKSNSAIASPPSGSRNKTEKIASASCVAATRCRNENSAARIFLRITDPHAWQTQNNPALTPELTHLPVTPTLRAQHLKPPQTPASQFGHSRNPQHDMPKCPEIAPCQSSPPPGYLTPIAFITHSRPFKPIQLTRTLLGALGVGPSEFTRHSSTTECP